ncbi:Pimeloyl-ACP methyl ester carboxylesterase [Filomicrobium insigne]|uniref:Pimeloyl-ACP methyl ester carboxylesterase n=2 Tax=Filomicrobium insigne TaxID=418854 RepID=A0A1H0SAJ2_9HYPH|nr:Pimeloyl-ACP methyl ester carboxylesterase [Filomicrobium insigne]
MHMDFEKERRFAHIDGSTMSYLDIGAGQTVVLGHSYLWSAEMWEPQIIALSKQYRVIVPELWGHGKSGELPANTRNLRQVAQRHLSLLDCIGIENFAVARLSVGDMRAVELALLAPQRVAGLALLGTFVGSEPAHSKELYFSMIETVQSLGAVPDPVIDAMLPMFFSSDALTHRQDLVDGFRKRLREAERRKLLESILPLGRMIFGRRDALADLRQLRILSLVITGEQDLSRPPEEGRQMASALGCTFVEIAGTGHISSLEAPSEVTEYLLSLLGEAF